jgi:hypothetical protein
MNHMARYVHLSIPCLIITIILLFVFFKNQSKLIKYKAIGITFLITLNLLNMKYLVTRINEHETVYATATKSFKKLAQNKIFQQAIKKKHAVCLFNLPQDLHFGSTQALWLMSQNDSYNVYLFGSEKHKIKHTEYENIIKNIQTRYHEEKILCVTWNDKTSHFFLSKER